MSTFYIAILLILALFIFIAIVTLMYIKFFMSAERLKAKKAKSTDRLFAFYSKFVLTKKSFNKLHQQVTSLSAYSVVESRSVTVGFYQRALGLSCVMFVLGALALRDLLSALILFVFAMVYTNVSVSKRIGEIEYTSLSQLGTYLSQLSESYTRLRNVPDALNDTPAPKLIRTHLTEIYSICISRNAKEQLDLFLNRCGNRVLRTLAIACYIRTDTGDDYKPGVVPPFKLSLRLIRDEVNREYRRRLNQKIRFGVIEKLPFVPILLTPAIEAFYSNIFPSTVTILNGPVGYVAKFSVLLSCLFSFYVVSMINESSIAESDDRADFMRAILSWSIVRKYARSLQPKSRRDREVIKGKLNKAMSMKSLEYYCLERIVLACLMVILAVIASLLILFNARIAAKNSLVPPIMSGTYEYTAQEKIDTYNFDAQVLDMPTIPSDDKLTQAYTKIFIHSRDADISSQVSRIKMKYKMYNALTFKYWFAFVYILAGLIGYYLPWFLLRLRTKLVYAESELDVMQLQTVIAILMDTTLDTLSVLYWLSKSSEIHKGMLTHAFHEFTRNSTDALTKLKSKSTSVNFSLIIDKLKTTASVSTLAEAFEDLVDERQNMLEIRDMLLYKELENKRSLAGPISTFPVSVWTIAMCLLPIGLVVYYTAMNMKSTLSGLSG